MMDELEIRVNSDAQISDGWCGRDVIAKVLTFYREGGCKVFAVILIAYEQEFGFIRI